MKKRDRIKNRKSIKIVVTMKHVECLLNEDNDLLSLSIMVLYKLRVYSSADESGR